MEEVKANYTIDPKPKRQKAATQAALNHLSEMRKTLILTLYQDRKLLGGPSEAAQLLAKRIRARKVQPDE